jgi:hypothetical protein
VKKSKKHAATENITVRPGIVFLIKLKTGARGTNPPVPPLTLNEASDGRKSQGGFLRRWCFPSRNKIETERYQMIAVIRKQQRTVRRFIGLWPC